MKLRVSLLLLLLLIPGLVSTQTYKFGFVLSKEDAFDTYQTIIGYAIDTFNKDSNITLVRRPLFPHYTFYMKLEMIEYKYYNINKLLLYKLMFYCKRGPSGHKMFIV